MKRAVLACLVIFCIGVTSMLAANSKLDFSLVNRTGLTIEEVYVSPSDDNEWGEDVMGRDVLSNDESVHISFSRRETACLWDVKVVDEQMDSIVWEKINLCKASEITLKYENKKPTAIIK